jgi:hypothetical protein
VLCDENNENLHQLEKNYMTFKNFWEITTTTDRRKSKEEKSALEQTEKSITKVGNHYEVCLLYNEAIAYQRLRCTERKVSKINLENQYNQKIQNFYVLRKNTIVCENKKSLRLIYFIGT